ncbi:MAG: hypothetical protein JXR88_11665, partial [Clostridia bacterium]|nr:hypothetical protein [Clostridia bacterium]
MKKLVDFLKRYYRCIFDFKLFKSYMDEPIYKAILFLVPVFLLFVFNSYYTSMTNPRDILEGLDYYYDYVSTLKYSDITDDPSYDLNETLNISFDKGVNIPQNKIFDGTFTQGDKTYRLILDTQNEKEIGIRTDNKYSAEAQIKFGHQTADMVLYVSYDFVIISVNDVILTHDLTSIEGTSETTLGIYTFIKDHYAMGSFYLAFSMIIVLFLYLMFYVVVYIISKSTIKRHDFKLDRKRMVKLSLYAMQPGMYTYFILMYLSDKTGFNVAFV